MKCEWPSLTKDSKCFRCGYALKRDYEKPPIRECTKQVPPTLTDYKLVNGEKQEVRIFRARCVHLGERLPDDKMAKVKCRTPSFTPVYKCDVNRLCTPFDQNTDSELISPCYNCSTYSGVSNGQ